MKIDASSVSPLLTLASGAIETNSTKQPVAVVEQSSDKVTISTEAAALFQKSLEDESGGGVVSPLNGGGTEPPLPPKDKN